MLRLRVVGSLALALGLSRVAEAATDERGRPFARRTVTLGAGVEAAGFVQDAVQVGFSASVSYFVLNGLALGLHIGDTIYVWRSDVRARFPGLEDRVPTNAARLFPALQYVFFRSRFFSPYVGAGIGPLFFNHGAGVLAEWQAMPGAYVHVGGRVYLDVGVRFSMIFPGRRCEEVLTFESASTVDDACGFQFSPRLGVAVAF